MSQVFFDELQISPPDYELGIGSASHGAQTGRMLEAIECVALEVKPDCVLVYGDTNSTLAGAVSAAKLRIPVAHVEAGLRSFNRSTPEEINRVLTDHASDMLFAPTATAVCNLLREGIPSERIRLVGDVMYDAALYYRQKAYKMSLILNQLCLKPKKYVLATVHRAENADDPQRLACIIDGLSAVADQIPVVMPLHPRTRKALERYGMLCKATARLRIIEPVGYLDMVMLEANARLIATDSGGVQKEAFFHRVPCVTLRDETEWTELVELGWNRLVSPLSPDTICCQILAALDSVGRESAPYGSGNASYLIARSLREWSERGWH
jgi:UDP-GlcNAc3NAcA epimerase